MSIISVADFDVARKDYVHIRKSTGTLGSGGVFRSTLHGSGDPGAASSPIYALGSSGKPVTDSVAGFPVIPNFSGNGYITRIEALAQVACSMHLYEVLWQISPPMEATETPVDGNLYNFLTGNLKDEVEYFIRCGSSTVTGYTGTLSGTDWSDADISDELAVTIGAYGYERYDAIPGSRYKTITSLSGGLVSGGFDILLVRQIAGLHVDQPYTPFILDALQLGFPTIRNTSALMLVTAPDAGYSATTRLWSMDIEISSK